MKHKAPHSHGWLVGIFGLAAGIALMVVFPKLQAVAGVVLVVALLHLVGAGTHVIDHLKENKKKGLAEIRRVLKPGGRLLMVVWVPGWITFSLANVFCFMLTTKAGWRKLATEVGLTIRDQGTFNGMWFAVLERPR